MKTNDRELTIFTPGLSSRSLKMDYYEIDNMVVTGLCGSGKDTTLTAIVKSMIESNKIGKFSYVFIDACYPHNPLANANRKTPYNELQIPLDHSRSMQIIYDTLLRLISVVVSRIDPVDNGTKLVDGTIVVIINNYDSLPEYLKLVVRYLIKRTVNTKQVKVIISGQPSGITKDILDNTRYKLCTRLTDDESNRILGCNIASRLADKYGSVWFNDSEEADVFTKHIVNATPDSFLNRMMKTYASGKQSSCEAVVKFRDADTKFMESWLLPALTELFDENALYIRDKFMDSLTKEGIKND